MDDDAEDYHARALRRERERDAVEAQKLIDAFVGEATAKGLPTDELLARPWSGTGEYRTGLVGWYLRNDRSIAVDLDGRYYVLIVPPQRLGRWRTVTVEPTLPTSDPGKGARDGESADLKTLLELRLQR